MPLHGASIILGHQGVRAGREEFSSKEALAMALPGRFLAQDHRHTKRLQSAPPSPASGLGDFLVTRKMDPHRDSDQVPGVAFCTCSTSTPSALGQAGGGIFSALAIAALTVLRLRSRTVLEVPSLAIQHSWA